MQAIDLSQLIPEESKITLKGKEYTLRPVTVSDWAWMEKKWGNDLSRRLSHLSAEELCVILFRLLEEKDDFLPIDKTVFDDDGESLQVRITGPQRFAEAIAGFNEFNECVKAFERCLGLHTLTDEQLEEAQKKILNMAQPQKSAGPESLTNSHQSTDTHQSK